MRENNRNSIEKCRKKLPQFTTMNVIDGQAGLVIYSSLIFYSLTIDNILNIIVLLILAAVSIATLTGPNGLLTRANEAKESTKQAEKEEQTTLSTYEDYIDKYTNEVMVDQVTDMSPGILEGNGTEVEPYVINSIEDLVFFAYDVTNGNTYEDKYVTLGLSLDFNSTKSYVDAYRTDYGIYGYDGALKTLLTSGDGFKPIGTNYDADMSTNYFCGIFDGNSKVIANLRLYHENSEYVSMVGFFTTNGGKIKNLIINKANITSITNNMHILSGILVGRNSGTILNCAVSGNASLTDNGEKSIYYGGLVGQSYGTIENCFSKAQLEIVSNKNSIVSIGGISGNNTGDYIRNCYNLGTINIFLNNDINILAGGITGNIFNKKIENSYNSGIINLYVDNNEQTKSIEIGNVTGRGSSGATIKNCFNIGDININHSIKNNQYFVSNIVGNIEGSISNCYNIGKINTENINSQFIGQIAGNAYKSVLDDCSGIINGNSDVIGFQHSATTIKNVKLIDKSEIPDILSILGNEFKEDINKINNGYPLLSWQ